MLDDGSRKILSETREIQLRSRSTSTSRGFESINALRSFTHTADFFFYGIVSVYLSNYWLGTYLILIIHTYVLRTAWHFTPYTEYST